MVAHRLQQSDTMTRTFTTLFALATRLLAFAAPALKPSTGDRILYVAGEPGNLHIWSVAVDGGVPEKLSTGDGDHLFPAWAPDGRRIAYSVLGPEGQQVYAMDSDGRNGQRLTKELRNNRGPAWSPDGRKIAFTATTATGASNVFVMDADGKNVTNLSKTAAYDGDPTRSPDVTKICFTSSRQGGFRLYVMDADGGNQNEITSAPSSTGRRQERENGGRTAEDEPGRRPRGVAAVNRQPCDGLAMRPTPS